MVLTDVLIVAISVVFCNDAAEVCDVVNFKSEIAVDNIPMVVVFV